ncbi:MAG: isoprenylcysteine carboxylmethyltransferase family protein [Terracidiphilus sp.]
MHFEREARSVNLALRLLVPRAAGPHPGMRNCTHQCDREPGVSAEELKPQNFGRINLIMNNLFLKAVGGLFYIFIAISALIFLSAWAFQYWQAWTFLAVFMISISAVFIYLAKCDPSLLARRIKTSEQEQSQKIIRFLINLAFAATVIVSALDHRFAWSEMRLGVIFIGEAVVLLGVIVIFVVFKENTFTAQTVEVEAGQTVVSTGPYALVRHSMYVGGLVFMLGIPPALGSWWGMLMILLFTPAIAWRILSEEKLLVRDLPGYLEYCNKVRYRLVPLVW